MMIQIFNRLCLNCYSYGNEDICTCGNKTIEIDELMIPSIIELNKKGYKTSYCCSGHLYDYDSYGFPCTYIKFDTEGEDFISIQKIANKMIPSLFKDDYQFTKKDKYTESIPNEYIWYNHLLQLELTKNNFIVCDSHQQVCSLSIRISESCIDDIHNISDFQNKQLMLIQSINEFAQDLKPII